MSRLGPTVLVTALSACGFTLNTGTGIDANDRDGSNAGSDAMIDDDASSDARIDASTVQWNQPQVLGFTGADDPTLSGDKLHIWFELADDLYHAQRASTALPFIGMAIVSELSNSAAESSPEVTSDGEVITFARRGGNNDVREARWNTAAQMWMIDGDLDDLNTPDHEQSASLSDDRLMIAFTRNAPTSTSDIYISTRTSPSSTWSTPAAVTELNTTAQEGGVHLSGDKLTICFDSNRNGQSDIYCATRTSPTGTFGAAEPISEINSSQGEQDPWLSPDGKLIVFWSDRDGAGKLWYAVHL